MTLSLHTKVMCVIAAFALLGSIGLSILLSYAAVTTLTAQINAGTLTIGGPTSLAFTTPLTVSFEAQNFEEHFTGTGSYFYVQDLIGADNGYSTTLQMSGNLTTGAYSIASGNVQFKASSTTPVLITGTANPRILIDANAGSYQAMHIARTYIYRDAALNTGVLSRYGQSIWLKVIVPANQPAGAYVGTIVYTLIEN